ncbi:hypothetical protein R1sor_014642 [Riccia sorocarpa]|uniref:Uncharacterized protein n=1 Tax=Riccia sorocarpa TaxID=122646 RepID=A0ABD3HA79_9MARC
MEIEGRITRTSTEPRWQRMMKSLQEVSRLIEEDGSRPPVALDSAAHTTRNRDRARDDTRELVAARSTDETETRKDLRELREALQKLEEVTTDSGIIPNMSVHEYIDFERVHELENQLSLEELADLQAVGDSDLQEELDPDDDGEREPAVTVRELFQACNTIQKFLEQSYNDTSKFGSKAKILHEEICSTAADRLIQSEITSYFSPE